MSLVARTSSQLFGKLSRSDPEEVAVQFAREYQNDVLNANIQLTDLILRSCGVFRSSPWMLSESVRNENIQEIVTFIETASPQLSDNINHSTLVQCFGRALLFFQHFWSRVWSDRDNNEVSYIQKLLLALSRMNEWVIKYFCIQICATYVTSVVKNKPNISQEQMVRIRKYACRVLKSSILFKHDDLLKNSLVELKKWMEFRPTDFAVNDCLCYIIWALKEESNRIILLALEILGSLLTHHAAILPQRFLLQCGLTFEALDMTEKEADEIFAHVCSCCITMRQLYLDNVIPNNVVPLTLEKVILDQLYSFEENKWRTAAEYWLFLNCDPNPFQYLRNAIKSARVERPSSTTLQYVSYFVDTLVDKCPVLTNWDLCVEVLTSQSYQDRLNVVEKQTLFVLVHQTAERVITGQRPKFRRSDGDDNECRDVEASKKFTLALRPKLEDIFKLEFADPALLLKIATYFHYDSLPKSTKENLIRFCVLAFQADVNFMVRRVAVQLLREIITSDSDNGIKNRCKVSIIRLKTLFENRVREKFSDFKENPVPDSFRDPTLSEDLFALRFIDPVMPVEKDVAFDLAITLLPEAYGPQESNPVFLAVQELCVVLSVKYVENTLKNNSDQINDVLVNAQVLGIYLGARLKEQARGTGFGNIPLFYGLCDVALVLKNRAAVTQQLPFGTLKSLRIYFVRTYPELDSKEQRYLMEKYLCMIDEDVLTMECVNDALSVHCSADNNDSELLLKQFLETQCRRRSSTSMVEWMMTIWRRIYNDERDERNKLWFCDKLAELIYSIRFNLKDLMSKCHLFGIDYATSNERRYSGFARIMSAFSCCLSLKEKQNVLKYAISKIGEDTDAFEGYIRALKTTEPLSATIDESTGTPERSLSVSSAPEEGPYDLNLSNQHVSISSDGGFYVSAANNGNNNEMDTSGFE